MNWETIRVSKLDAARRQLDSAIELWFREGDPVSIHTLVFAAYSIIEDINKKHSNDDATLLGMAQQLVKPEHVREVIQLLKKAMTFFKHANRDPYAILEFAPQVSDCLIILSMFGLGKLGEPPTDFQRVFNFWECVHRPEFILDGENPIFNNFNVIQIEEMRKLSKREFCEAGLQAVAQSKIRL